MIFREFILRVLELDEDRKGGKAEKTQDFIGT